MRLQGGVPFGPGGGGLELGLHAAARRVHKPGGKLAPEPRGGPWRARLRRLRACPFALQRRRATPVTGPLPSSDPLGSTLPTSPPPSPPAHTPHPSPYPPPIPAALYLAAQCPSFFGADFYHIPAGCTHSHTRTRECCFFFWPLGGHVSYSAALLCTRMSGRLT